MTVVLASHNKKKIKELSDILCGMFPNLELLTPADVGVTGDIEENGKTFEENAMIKASAVWAKGRIAIADDSGLCVNALGGAPGIYSARYAGEPSDDTRNNEKLLSELKSSEDRSAYFICTIACILPNGERFTVSGKAYGEILDRPVGVGGFGYDPLFLSTDTGKSFAELSADEKNSISHRGRALKALKERIAEKLEQI